MKIKYQPIILASLILLQACVNPSHITNPKSKNDTFVIFHVDDSEYRYLMRTAVSVPNDNLYSETPDNYSSLRRNEGVIFYSRYIKPGIYRITELRSSEGRTGISGMDLGDKYITVDIQDAQIIFNTNGTRVLYVGSFKLVTDRSGNEKLLKNNNGLSKQKAINYILNSKFMKGGKWKKLLQKELSSN